MPGSPVTIGPFLGGLNNKSRADEAKDNELVELVNMEVTTDGSLTSRPPMSVVSGSVVSTVAVNNTWKVLGVLQLSAEEWYLIVYRPNTGGGKTEAHLNGIVTATPTYVIVTHGVENDAPADAVQFGNTMYFIATVEAAGDGFSWNPSEGFKKIVAMPKGTIIISWKERLWVTGRGDINQGSRVRYSKLDVSGPKPTTWDSQDYLDIAFGEGGYITGLIPVYNNLIVFKTDGTWRFSYPGKVSQGSVDRISSIGAASRFASVEFENMVYVYDQGKIYELMNNNFTQLNTDLRIDEDEMAVNPSIPDVDLSIVNRRLLVRYRNAMYAYNIETKTWSQWRTLSGIPSKFWELPGDSTSSQSPTFIAASLGQSQRSMNYIDGFSKLSSNKGGWEIDSETGKLEVEVTSGTSSFQFSNDYIDSNEAFTYTIPVSAGQKFQATADTTGGSIKVYLRTLKEDGTYGNDSKNSTTGVWDFTVPNNSIMSKVIIEFGVGTFTVDNFRFGRIEANAPKSLISLVDEYEDIATHKELIECTVRTKGMTFGAPQSFKRLFWWGLDIKTYFGLRASAVPLARRRNPLWGDLNKYTNGQLMSGTYANPLSWINTTLTVVDENDPESEVSDNGRFFVKLLKALRFRQISFKLETKTTGNSQTGPAKVFAITAIVDTKQTVVDKVS